ncbi:hypothetical protein AGOR_G00249520 [Albula goreensis]|uniref:PNPLA domain-containing protein n=1 Tax=Albula goreensis TaxID=1534307 RepID=A0A8T3CBZ5_9TELE|nr:hypothetical protein AGOR_G00249520 [Albula goreensis]
MDIDVLLEVNTYTFTLSWLGNLWQTQGQKQVWLHLAAVHHLPSRLYIRRQLSHKAGYLNWKQIQSTKRRGLNGWLCRASQLRHKLGLYASVAHASISSPRGSSSLSHHMSRIRSTLDSVTKAVSGTHTDLLSKIARLKPSAVPVSSGESGPTLEATAEPPALPPPPSTETPPPPVSAAPPPREEGPPIIEVPAKPNGSLVASHAQLPGGTASASSTVTTVTRQTSDLFHPSYFSVNLGETYNYLAHHVNAYFGTATKMDEKKVEDMSNSAKSSAVEPGKPRESTGSTVPIPMPVSAKKGIGHYLPNPGPSVQAFVGSYIAPLVPKFRSDPKSVMAEKEKTPPVVEVPAETAESKEQKAAEDRAKRLLQQREKIIARVSVDNRTRALVQALYRASDVKLYIKRVEDLSYHLLEFPETRGVAVKEKVIPCLLRLRQAGDPTLQAAVREALTLVGYTDPVKGRGIRVLSIDGGGTRGLVALQTLHRLEDLTGKPIYQLFDYICGVSTGAILAFMLGVYQIPLAECEEMYRKLGSDVFKQNVIVGTVKMGWSHAFYDSEAWENILKERVGSELMVETSRNPKCPKVAAVSTLVNRGTPLKAYVFRNYNLQPGVRSHYLGGCHHKLWQAIRASSAAPGYFQEFVLGNDLHQDGGLLINNPTALAVHECKCLWPNTPLQCVVSLGTGRFEGQGKNNATYTSLKAKLTNVISSATDTEEVHTMLDALLPPDTYFRFNPYLNERSRWMRAAGRG